MTIARIIDSLGDKFLKQQDYGRPIRSILKSCLLSGFLTVGAVQAEEAKLVVNLQEILAATGNLRVALYLEPETFRKEDRAVKVISIPAVKGDAQVVFESLTPGRYAIVAYHDENGDGKLNLRFGMFPTEGYGLSNNPKVVGPPKFADSAFNVSGPETSVSIRVSY